MHSSKGFTPEALSGYKKTLAAFSVLTEYAYINDWSDTKWEGLAAGPSRPCINTPGTHHQLPTGLLRQKHQG